MATFGKNTIGAYSISYATGTKRGSRFALSEAGTVTAISLYLTNVGSASVKFAIYSTGADGRPANKIWADDVGQTCVNGWNTKNGLNVPLQPGNYWLCWMTNASTTAYYDAEPCRAWNTQAYTEPWPDSWGTTNYGEDRSHSIYCTYTPSSGVQKNWSAPLRATHVLGRPYRSMKLSQTVNTAHTFVGNRSIKLTQNLLVLNAWIVEYPILILKHWSAMLQAAHVFNRPIRVLRLPTKLQASHLSSRPLRSFSLLEGLGVLHEFYAGKPVTRKTKLLLVLGDLAIQLSND